jgi:ORF6N domain
MATAELVPFARVAAHIYWIRGKSAMLDSDLALLYGVETRVLNQAVTRNRERFPEDFCFELAWNEFEALRSQIVILETDTPKDARGAHRKHTPRAFTQEGVAMLSGVLRSKQAVEVNIGIVRAFLRMREILASNEELARRVAQHDHEIGELFEHVRALLEPAPETVPAKRPIGFSKK